MQPFREIITALISVTILTISCWMMLDTYRTARSVLQSAQPDPQTNATEIRAKLDAYSRQKDILLYALALLGTVTGYYLGRVPAELRANSAQAQVSSANSAATQANAQASQAAATRDLLMRDTRNTLTQVLPMIVRAKAAGTARDTTGTASPDILRVEAEIESLLRRVEST